MSDPTVQVAAPCARRQVHLRRIVCTGYERDDGLWDIEGRLIDIKPFPLELPEHTVAADEPIHEMTVCLTIDRQWVIRDAVARTVHSPYRVCGDIAASYRQLIGLRIEPGFTQRVKRLFRGTLGCSHMTELLPPMATTAFQILWAQPQGFGAPDRAGASTRSSPLGACHALRLDGEVVKVHFSHLLGATDLR